MSSTLFVMPTAMPSVPSPSPHVINENTPFEKASVLIAAHRHDLFAYLTYIRHHHFADLPHVNEVEIAYCRPWKTRLGLIRMSLDNSVSFIGINSLLRSVQAPEYVLITTIAHELVHYAHGFGSPLPRLYEHPHANRVVERELERRGLATTLHACDTWIEENWYDFYASRKNGR